jgi:hypothetical protein
MSASSSFTNGILAPPYFFLEDAMRKLFVCCTLVVISGLPTVMPLFPAETPGPPGELRIAAVSNGWDIKRFVLNDSNAVVFAGGDFQGLSDGIVHSWAGRLNRLAHLAYEPPGMPGTLYAGFPGRHSGDLALNQAGDVAFTASIVPCPGGLDLAECLAHYSRINGLFRIHNQQGSRIAVGEEPVPGREGLRLHTFDRIWLNESGDIAFKALVYRPNVSSRLTAGLFVSTGGRIITVAIEGDPEIDLSSERLSLVFEDSGAIVFFSPVTGVVFRFQGEQLRRLLAPGVHLSDADTITSIHTAVPNRTGQVVFHASFGPAPIQQGIYLLNADGSIERVLADGDPVPGEGEFSLWSEETDRFGGRRTFPAILSLKLNDAGKVLFSCPVRAGTGSAALFAFDRGRLLQIVTDGDARPDVSGGRFEFSSREIEYALNNSGLVAFRPARDALFLAQEEKAAALSASGEQVTIQGIEYSIGEVHSFILNNARTVAFHAPLCCGPQVAGILLARPRAAAVPNASFDLLGDFGLPAAWTTWWTNSGQGDAGHYYSAGKDAYYGDATLRLHVKPGGGSVFVLSDPAVALPEATYLLESRMRFYFDNAADTAYFTVLQFYSAGAIIAQDEVPARKGDSHWTWDAKSVLIRTLSNAAFLRYRFGLIAAGEKYLDVDAVH